MSPTGDIWVDDQRRLLANGHVVLTDVPPSVIVTSHIPPPSSASVGGAEGQPQGVFVGSRFREPHSWHVFEIGTLKDVRFLCCFRFKLWWMTQRVGQRGRELPVETQFLLLEASQQQQQGAAAASAAVGSQVRSKEDGEITYVVVLPLLDGSFRTALQGSADDRVEACVESGDPFVKTSESLHALYIHAGDNPYTVISEAVKAVEAHTGSFLHREKKQLPGLLDCFGWCTWDAFYTQVDAKGVKQGLASLSDGGTPAKFLIIDDGWQSVAADAHEDSTLTDRKSVV